MHTDANGALGFKQTIGFAVSSHNSCTPFKAYHNGVLKEFPLIPNADASVIIVSKYDGGHSISAVPSELSSQFLSRALLAAMPMAFSTTMVAQTLEDEEGALTYTITFGKNDGDIPQLVCNPSKALTDILATCTAHTVVDGNVIGGGFLSWFLWSHFTCRFCGRFRRCHRGHQCNR